MAYTYDEFMNAAQRAGLYGQFSQEDLATAQQYPEFGMSILSLKQDWNNAQTPEARVLANQAANELRRSYGGYYGNQSGTGYVSTGRQGAQLNQTLQKLGSYTPFSFGQAPEYQNPYAAQQQKLLNDILNREDFSWSKETDPSWAAYQKQYRREGDRATQNALAQAAAMTGGRPSSYAATAASQAGDYYAQQLSDKIPELYQQAYDRYLQDYQQKLTDLSTLNTQQQLGYKEYLDRLGQFNTDRDLAYDEWVQRYNMDNNYAKLLQEQEQTEYQRALDREQQALAALQQTAAGGVSGGGRGGRASGRASAGTQSGGGTGKAAGARAGIDKNSAFALYNRSISDDELAALIASGRVTWWQDPDTNKIKVAWRRSGGSSAGGNGSPTKQNTDVLF